MRYFSSLIIAGGLIAGAVSTPALAGSIDGNWRGKGTAKLKDGQVEPVSCKVSYTKDTGRTYLVSVTCSHSAGTFQTSGRVVEQSSTKYTGRLYSEQYSVSGKVGISVSGNTQRVTAISEKGTANLRLTKR